MKLSKAQITALANKLAENESKARTEKIEALKQDKDIKARAKKVFDIFTKAQAVAQASELEISVSVNRGYSNRDTDTLEYLTEKIAEKEAGESESGRGSRHNWNDRVTIASIDATDLATLCATLGVTL